MMQRIIRNTGMNVIGGMRTRIWNVLGGNRRLRRLAMNDGRRIILLALRVEFAFGLEPMSRILAVGLTGFLPKLVGATCDGLVADRNGCFHAPKVSHKRHYTIVPRRNGLYCAARRIAPCWFLTDRPARRILTSSDRRRSRLWSVQKPN